MTVTIPRQRTRPPLEFQDFRLYLQEELVRRCKQNPQYSLRSFARSLGVDHSALSRILRRDRGISPKIFETIANSLNLSPSDASKFKSLLRLKPTRTISQFEFQNLSIDTFSLFSEWYHDAILELMRLKNFQPNSKWISKKLGITVSEANIATERLQRLGLIEVSHSGDWISHADHTEMGVSSPYTTTALKRYQKQILKMAIEAIDESPREKRHNISTTMAIDVADLEEMKRLINEFRRKLCRFAQRKNIKANQVYQFGVCLYPLTERK